MLDPWISTYTLQALVSKYGNVSKICVSIIDSWPFWWTFSGRKLFEQQNFTGSRWFHPQHTRMPGPLFLPSRPSWRGAHSWLRGHIWLVVIFTFGEIQANITITRLLWVISSNKPYELFQDLTQMCPLQTRIWHKCAPFKFLGFKSNFLDLRTFV